ncbi:DUF397 domain-containing protein [Streptomyces sp. SBR177]
MRSYDLDTATWIKSSHSGDNGGNCVEVASGVTGCVPVRDSKAPEGPAVVFGRGAWDAFVHSL